MNVFGWVLLAAVAVAAGADVRSVARGSGGLERPAAPAVPVLLGLWAWLAHAETTTPGRLLLVALLAWLVGDVLLLTPAGPAAGPIARLVGHVAALLGVLALPTRAAGWPAGVLVVLLGAAAVVAVRRRALAAERSVAGVATAYGVVLVLAAALAWWRGAVLPASGLTLLAVGDLLLAAARVAGPATRGAVDRPVGRGRALPVVVTLAHHGGASLVVLGLVRPDLVG